ncbi:MAG TPA: VOC family protein [Gemmatimonadales bacterium]|nr:VOC family protein [Gemmatimonadales bacterium]
MSNGKICYVEIPSDDVERSARFYVEVFGWTVRIRGDGQRAFDDSTGAVSGSWVLGRPPQRQPGMLTYIMVDSIEQALGQVTAAGGTVVTPLTPLHAAGEAFATFADPGGNVVGLYQQPRT